LVPASGSFNAMVLSADECGFTCTGPGTKTIRILSSFVTPNVDGIKASCEPFGPAEAIADPAGVIW
jgi:hypothetical protein